MIRFQTKPYQIRDYELVRELLTEKGLENSKEGIRILKLVGKPAARAQDKLDRGPKDPKKAEWDKAYEACWKSFSIYIRTRDTRQVGESRRGKCVTCDNVYDIKDLQAGHWIPTANWGTKFHEQNVHAQCWACNDKMRGNGRMPIHEAAIRVLHGETAPERLKGLTRTHGRKLSDKELWAKKAEFDRKLENFLGREAVGEPG